MILAWDGGTPVLSQRTPDPELVGGDIVPDVPSIPSLVNIRGVRRLVAAALGFEIRGVAFPG
jgi:hypothetical protein